MTIQRERPRHTFSLSAYRYFRKFVGEVTATATGNEIALRTTVELFPPDSPLDNWSIKGKELGLMVNGLESVRLINSCSRLHIVSLYSGWDGFIRSLRTEYQKLFFKNWQHNDGDTTFNEIYRHSPISPELLKQYIDSNRQTAIEYYRKVRNAIVHPASATMEEVKLHFRAHEVDLIAVRQHYNMISPPNEYDSLTFHDVKLLARLLLDVGAIISESFDPGDDNLMKVLPFNLWARVEHDEKRFHNKIVGYLRTEFGLEASRATKIVSQL